MDVNYMFVQNQFFTSPSWALDPRGERAETFRTAEAKA
jgi:hypothetical protein